MSQPSREGCKTRRHEPADTAVSLDMRRRLIYAQSVDYQSDAVSMGPATVAIAPREAAPLAALLRDELDRVENLKIVQTDVATVNRRKRLDLGVLCRDDFHPRGKHVVLTGHWHEPRCRLPEFDSRIARALAR